MGRRTQSRIGTTDGVFTARVYSANPKTPDGFNTFIFRRDVARSLDKLFWLPIIDGRGNPIPEDVALGDKSVRYTPEDRRTIREFVVKAAVAQRGTVRNDDFGEIPIGRTFVDEVQFHAVSTRREVMAVSSSRVIASTMVHLAGSPNEELKPKRGIKYVEYGLARLRLADGVYLVMGEVGIRVGSRAYYDQRVVAKFKADSEVASLHGQPRIGESAVDEIYDNRFRLILQGVRDYFSGRAKSKASVAKDDSSMSTIVIPVYNEGENILKTLAELDAKVSVPATTCLVYDREDDTTLVPARTLLGKTRIPFALVKNKYGRGALNAIKTGLEDAKTPLVVVTMADLCDPPEVINDLVAAAGRERADIVCASRYMKGGRQYGGPKFKGFLSHTAGLLLCWFARLPTHDPTNSFKLYRKSFLDTVKIESTGGFELGIELVVKCRAMGGKIAEVPTTWRDRVAGKSNFKLWKWLPNYLRWFFYGFTHKGLINA